MRILVTGGAGFIGSHLVDFLVEKGHDVRVIDNLYEGKADNVNPDAEFIFGDITDPKLCDKATKDIEIVYHLAAHAAESQSFFMPVHNAQTNIIGSLELLKSCINNNVSTFVFTSSIAVYGNSSPMVEEQVCRPVDPYGISKYAVEQYIQSLCGTYGINYSILRLHNVYGPRMNLDNPYRNVVALFMNRTLASKRPIIFGDGSCRRAFTYVDDVVQYISKAGTWQKCFGQILNIGSEEVMSVKELAHTILNLVDSPLEPVYVDERPNEVRDVFSPSAKAKEILGYETYYSIDMGLSKTLEWFRILKDNPEYKYRMSEISKKYPKVWGEQLI